MGFSSLLLSCCCPALPVPSPVAWLSCKKVDSEFPIPDSESARLTSVTINIDTAVIFASLHHKYWSRFARVVQSYARMLLFSIFCTHKVLNWVDSVSSNHTAGENFFTSICKKKEKDQLLRARIIALVDKGSSSSLLGIKHEGIDNRDSRRGEGTGKGYSY